MYIHNEPTIKATADEIAGLYDEDGTIAEYRLNALLTEAYRLGAGELLDAQIAEAFNAIPEDTKAYLMDANGQVTAEYEPEPTIRTRDELLAEGFDANNPVDNFVHQCEPKKGDSRGVFYAALPEVIELARSGAYKGASVDDYLPSYKELQMEGGPNNDNPIERLLWHCTPPDGEGRFRELLRQVIEGM